MTPHPKPSTIKSVQHMVIENLKWRRWLYEKENGLNYASLIWLLWSLVTRDETLLIGANILLLGALACHLRRRHKWIWLETISVICIALLIPILLSHGAWFENLIYKLPPLIAVPFYYLRVLKTTTATLVQKRSRK